MRVFVTGHTGFTGAWLCLMLRKLGAEVIGFALEPTTNPSLFKELELGTKVEHNIGDIRDSARLLEVVRGSSPDLVLHLAAQPLVRESYINPVDTFETNVMGTVNVLQACRDSEGIKGILAVTSDKVYENSDSGDPFREDSRLGGADPYSASKAGSEIAINSYRSSFYDSHARPIPIVSARGGNIVGGGDWSRDRIVPDFIKAWRGDGILEVRNPSATRPWQHVLSLGEGYLKILSKMASSDLSGLSLAYNLGPNTQQETSVLEIIHLLSQEMPGVTLKYSGAEREPRESMRLRLDSSRAAEELNWLSTWGDKEVIEKTAEWYKGYYNAVPAAVLCEQQIELVLQKHLRPQSSVTKI